MPLNLICTCGARFTLDESFAGREVLCPECQKPLLVPTTGAPVVRVSKLALVSFVLALVGAFTVIGTAIAAVLGLIASLRIARRRTELAGLPFALAGLILGVGLTVLTTMALAGDYFKSLAGVYREALLTDQLDRTGELSIRRGDKGFLLERPDATWGIARRNKIDDEFHDTLRVRRTPEVLLVQPGRSLFVDVRRDTIEPKVSLTIVQSNYFERMRWKGEPLDEWGRPDPWRQGRANRWDKKFDDIPDMHNGWNPEDAEEPFDPSRPSPVVVNSVRELGSRELTVRNDRDQILPECSGLEVGAIVEMPGRSWRLLVRFYRVGDIVYIVRGYTPSNAFTPATEAELRQVLDSFRVLR